MSDFIHLWTVKFIVCILTILQLFSNTVVVAQDRSPSEVKYILILHSYHQGLEWTDNISEGIQSVFRDEFKYELDFEYLDTKRNFSDEYYEALRTMYKTKSKRNKFDIIITSDNAAYNFMRRYGDENYPGIPVVYCGVNNMDTTQLMDHPRFYGFGEKADHEQTLNGLQQVFPERKNVLIINDNTLTGQAILNELQKVLPLFDNQLFFEIYSEFTLPSLQQKVMSLDNSYAIYLLVVNRDKNGEFISYHKGISSIQQVSNVPIFGSWDFYLGKGLLGGKITSGFQQGKNAAQLAEKIITHGITDSIRQFNNIKNDYIFDYHQMLKFDVSLDQLPKNSQVINLPAKEDFLLKISIYTSAILLLITFFLLLRLKIKRKRAIILNQLVEEKTVNLKKANLTLEDIITKKNKFISILAHDLRNSIGVLLNSSMLLNNPKLNLKPDRVSSLKKEIMGSANQTYELLEDLLYWGMKQFQDNPLINTTEFNLNKVLNSITNTYQINISNTSFVHDFPEEVILCNDVNICKFIFRNVIQNAIKFSHKNGVVKISSQMKEDSAVVSISDEGIGMTAEIIASIYNKKPITNKGKFDQKNSGLGLPTVMDYLEILNGQISIESTPGTGSRFTIIIPNRKLQETRA